MEEQIEQVGRAVLDSAFKVHTVLGPGLLESVYESAMAIELRKRGYRVERQKAVPVRYEGELLDVGFRADLIVNDLVLVELKSVHEVTDLFKKITRNHLKLIPLRLGFLINFNEPHLRDGITRIVNGLDGKEFFLREEPVTYTVSSPSPPSPLRETEVVSRRSEGNEGKTNGGTN
jgi:GxxExxY protein